MRERSSTICDRARGASDPLGRRGAPPYAGGLILKVLAAIVVVFWVGFAFRSAFLLRRLLVFEVERGVRIRARGRIPRDALSEIADVLARARATGTIEVHLDGRSAVRVRVKRGDLSDATLQQLRNVVGRFPRARLESGTRFRLDRER